MKKKLLTVLFVAVIIATIMSVLAVVTSAAVTGSTSNEYGDVKYVDGIAEVSAYDTTSRAVLKNADGTYTTYPAYYIYNGSSDTNMRLSFSKLNEKTGESYTNASLIRVEVFKNARLNWTYQDCSSLIDVYLPEGTFLHYASFTGCSSLVSIKLPSTGVTQIPNACFDNCISLESIEFPSTVTSLGQSAFQNCNKLSVIKFPEGYTSIVPQDFRKISNGKETTPVTYIIPKGCTGVNSKYSLDNCSVKEIIFTGTADSAFITDLTNDAPGWVSKVVYANHCEYYFDNNHTEPDASCETSDTCTRCGVQTTTASEHVFVDKILYVNGFATEGKLVTDCTNAGCTESDTEEVVEALFQALGYSVGPDGYSLKAGFKVNNLAVERYKELYPDFTFGIVMANAGTIASNENFIVNEALNSSAKGLMIPVDGLKYVSLTADASGFSAEIASSLELVVGIYTNDAEGNISIIQYIDADKYATTKTYADMSLNAITFNQVRVGHGMEALVPQPAPAPAGDEE